jgi:hypothetical protein
MPLIEGFRTPVGSGNVLPFVRFGVAEFMTGKRDDDMGVLALEIVDKGDGVYEYADPAYEVTSPEAQGFGLSALLYRPEESRSFEFGNMYGGDVDGRYEFSSSKVGYAVRLICAV